jgi:hypothetical protein
MDHFIKVICIMATWTYCVACCPSPKRDMLIRQELLAGDPVEAECARTAFYSIVAKAMTRDSTSWAGRSRTFSTGDHFGALRVTQSRSDPRVFSIQIRLPAVGVTPDQLISARREMEDVANGLLAACSTHVEASNCKHLSTEGVIPCPAIPTDDTGNSLPMTSSGKAEAVDANLGIECGSVDSR